MPESLQKPLPPMPLNSLDGVRPKPAKAGLDGQPSSTSLMAVVREGLIRRHGSLKAAAISMGMDLGQLSRELGNGDLKLKRLDGDEPQKAQIAAVMRDAYDVDPKAEARRLVRDLRRTLDALADVVEVA